MRAPRLSRQMLSSLFFIVVGASALVKAADYRIGSVTQMGPGYFPACLGILLVLLGVLGAIQSLAGPAEPASPLRFGPPALVIVSVAFFAVAVDRLGLIPTVVGVVAISCLPSLRRRPVEILAMACGLCLLTATVFVKFLGLPFKLY